MNPHYKFPNIEQLRHVLLNLKHKYQNPQAVSDERRWIFDESMPLPSLEFTGTIKLHGTNAAIIFEPTNGRNGFLYAQSREQVLTLKNDNNGFCAFLHRINEDRFVNCIPKDLTREARELDVPIIIYGEWCGRGIQSNVAVSKLEKLFVVFAVKVGERWCNANEFHSLKSPEDRIFNIFDYPIFKVFIDFNNISDAILKSLEDMTSVVEEECPFSMTFGVHGTGEGIVWTCYEELDSDGSPIRFKTKGEKHKNVKETRLVQIDVDKANDMATLVERVATVQRFEQGFQILSTTSIPERKNIPEFIKWVQNDIMKENQDILIASKLDQREVMNAIQRASREWFLQRVK